MQVSVLNLLKGESIFLHLSFAGVTGTSGSTCLSEALKVSHVLKANGIDPFLAHRSLTFTLGIDNTREDVDLLLKELPKAVDELRALSPFSRSTRVA